MILELATFDIKNGQTEAFKTSCEKAKAVVSQSKGFQALEFHQCIETPNKFVLMISWDTLEDHTIGFRKSELFKEWRAILSPYFNSPPVAEHYEIYIRQNT